MYKISPILMGLFTSIAIAQQKPIEVYPFLYLTPAIKEDSILLFVDSSNSLTINDIVKPKYQAKFFHLDSINFYTTQKNVAYWTKYLIKSSRPGSPIFIEKDNYSQKIDYYFQDSLGKFNHQKAGLAYFASEWTYIDNGHHFFLIQNSKPSQLVYCRLEADFITGLGQYYYDTMEFHNRKKEEFFVSGIINGVIVLMIIISFLLWIGLKEKVYLSYFFYILNFGFFMFVFEGNFAALISGYLRFSYDFYTIPYAMMTIFFMLYIFSFANASKFKYNKEIAMTAVILRIVLLFMPYIFPNYALYFRTERVDFFFLLPSVYFVIQSFKTKNEFSLLLLGSLIAVCIGQLLNIFKVEFVANSFFYSFALFGLIEIITFLGILMLRFRQIKKQKEWALAESIAMKEESNRILEERVKERTQTIELLYKKIQGENIKLEEENLNNAKARIKRKQLNYNEFLKIYPDDNSSFEFIDQLKWGKGFVCKKCGNTKYSQGNIAFSRRCSKCAVIETLPTNTIFAGIKFPISKAMYMVAISNHIHNVQATDLAKELDLRLQTCWQFKNKIIERLRNTDPKTLKDDNWEELIVNK